MRALLIAIALAAAAPPAAADPEASQAFADAARTALETGDRQGAILAALRGLPADPTEADFAVYTAAHDMLFRAVAARIVKMDRVGPQFYAVNSTGDRAVMGGTVPRAEAAPAAPLGSSTTLADLRAIQEAGLALLDSIDPYTLIDPRDGTVIADLAPAALLLSGDGVWGPSIAPAFSPDGSQVALWAMDAGEVRLFSAEDGAALPPLTDLAGRVPGTVIGYSHDGRYLAAWADGRFAIWDMATGALSSDFDLEGIDGRAGMTWLPDGDLLVASAAPAADGTGAYRIARLGPDGAEALFDVPGRLDGWRHLHASPFGPHAILEHDVAATLFNIETGAFTAFEQGPGARFLRDGSAIGLLDDRWSLAAFLGGGGHDLSLIDHDGNSLTPTLRDWPPLEQFVTDLDGKRLDTLGPPRPFPYRAEAVPTGLELYQAVWAALPEATQADIDADRVSR